jgi:hypothetical protein
MPANLAKVGALSEIESKRPRLHVQVPFSVRYDRNSSRSCGASDFLGSFDVGQRIELGTEHVSKELTNLMATG